MPRIASFRDLDVYQLGVREAKRVFLITRQFPKEETYSLTDQIRRSSRAVNALLAEAWARRRYVAAFVNKVNESLGEAMETHRSSIVGLVAVLAALAFTACRQDMHDQPKYKPLRPVDQIGTINDGRSARPQVEGTVARGELREDVEFYTGRIARSGQTIDNISGGPASQPSGQSVTGAAAGLQGFVSEFPMQITEADLDRGQQRFNIYCSVCHGPLGDGGGMIPKRGFRRPPSYHDDRLRNAPVGYFFDVITKGFGNMPDYSAQVEPADRWRIIAYIRALQLSQHAPVSDVPADKRGELNKRAEAAGQQGHEGAK